MISLGFLEFHMALKDFNNWLARYGNRPGSRSVSPKPCGCTGKNNSAGRTVAVIPAYASGTPELPVLMSDILHFLYFLASSCTFFTKVQGCKANAHANLSMNPVLPVLFGSGPYIEHFILQPPEKSTGSTAKQ